MLAMQDVVGSIPTIRSKGKKMLYILILLWILFGIVAFGIQHAFFVREFPILQEDEYRNSIYFSCMIFHLLCGFLAFVAVLVFVCLNGFYGIKFNRKYEEGKR